MAEAHDSAAPSLRFRLRDSTAEAHRRLEAAIGLEDRCRRRDAYGALLARFWGFYAPLEAALARVDWDPVDQDLSQRAKLPWLTADLLALGWSLPQIEALPQARALPPVDGVADAFGVLYVLEGSTLGGQTIVPVIRGALGITEESGGRFFASYGRDVGVKWRSYVAALERFGADSPVADRIALAAHGAFESFIQWAGEAAEAAPRARRRAHDS